MNIFERVSNYHINSEIPTENTIEQYLPQHLTTYLYNLEKKYNIKINHSLEVDDDFPIHVEEIIKSDIMFFLKIIGFYTNPSIYIDEEKAVWKMMNNISQEYLMLLTGKDFSNASREKIIQYVAIKKPKHINIFENMAEITKKLIVLLYLKKTSFTIEKNYSDEDFGEIYQQMIKNIKSPEEIRFINDIFIYIFLTSKLIIETLNSIPKDMVAPYVNGKERKIELFGNDVFYELKKQILEGNKNLIPLLVLEIIKIVQKINTSYRDITILHILGLSDEIDEQKAVKLKQSKLFEQNLKSILVEPILINIFCKNNEYFLHKKKIPYETTFHYIMKNKENKDFLKKIDIFLQISSEAKLSLEEPLLLEVLFQIKNNTLQYTIFEYETIVLLIKYKINTTQIFTLSQNHLKKIFQAKNLDKKIIQQLVDDENFLEKEFKISLENIASKQESNSEIANSLYKLIESDLSIDELKAQFQLLQIQYNFVEITQGKEKETKKDGKLPTPIKIEKKSIHTLEYSIKYYFGETGYHILSEYFHQNEGNISLETIQKIIEIGEKTPKGIRDDFLLEYVSGSFSPEKIDFFLKCINIIKYFKIRIFDYAECKTLLHISENTDELLFIEQSLSISQIGIIENISDLRNKILYCLEHKEYNKKQTDNISVIGNNMFDDYIRTTLLSQDKEKIHDLCSSIDYLLGNIITQFHASQTTSTSHSNFGEGSGTFTSIIKSHLLNKLKRKTDETEKQYLKRLCNLNYNNYLGNISYKDTKGNLELGFLVKACETEKEIKGFFYYLDGIKKIIRNIQLLQKNNINLTPLENYYSEILQTEIEKFKKGI